MSELIPESSTRVLKDYKLSMYALAKLQINSIMISHYKSWAVRWAWLQQLRGNI